jgi:hypothetical protein
MPISEKSTAHLQKPPFVRTSRTISEQRVDALADRVVHQPGPVEEEEENCHRASDDVDTSKLSYHFRCSTVCTWHDYRSVSNICVEIGKEDLRWRTVFPRPVLSPKVYP